MIENDTDIAYKFKNFPNENRVLKFCVGKTVGGKFPEVSRVFLIDSLVDFTLALEIFGLKSIVVKKQFERQHP